MTPAATNIDPSTTPGLVALLVSAIVSLAIAIVILWRYYSGREAKVLEEKNALIESHSKERQAWALERQRLEDFKEDLRADFDSKHLVLSSKYADQIKELYESSREHENQIRQEYLDNMNLVAKQASESLEKVGGVLNKLYERVTARGRGGRDL